MIPYDDKESLAYVRKPVPGDTDLPLREDYLTRIAWLESLPENQSGADKTWLVEALEESRRQFEKSRRIR